MGRVYLPSLPPSNGIYIVIIMRGLLSVSPCWLAIATLPKRGIVSNARQALVLWLS